MENAVYFRKTKKLCAVRSRKMQAVLIAASAVLIFAIIVNLLIAKPLESLAEKRVGAEAAKLLNDSLREVMGEYAAEGGGEFAKEQRSGGEGTVLFIDAVALNLMAARVTERAQSKVAELGACGVEVPLGSVSGVPLLNGAGPRIPVKIEPIGEVSGRFSSKFEDAGVNQTRYSAMLTVSASMDMVVFGRVRSVSTTVSAPVCETIVVGGVPAAYTNVESIDDALNLIPTEVGGIFEP